MLSWNFGMQSNNERDWAQYQTPKNLAVSIGAAELEKGEK
jgi:hypothetical protein